MMVMAKKKTQPPEDRHKRKTRSYRLSQQHIDAMEAIADKCRWSKTTALEVAIEELAKAHGVQFSKAPADPKG